MYIISLIVFFSIIGLWKLLKDILEKVCVRHNFIAGQKLKSNYFCELFIIIFSNFLVILSANFFSSEFSVLLLP